MYDIYFYQDERGNQPVKEYLDELVRQSATNKDARINANKIKAQFRELNSQGTMVGFPTIRDMGGALYELRPLANRIFFFYHSKDGYVMLHHFIKKSNNTPRNELEIARNCMRKYIETNGGIHRGDKYEN